MKSRLLLICVVLLVILLIACRFTIRGVLCEGTIINKYAEEHTITIRREDDSIKNLWVTPEVFDSVEVDQHCTFFTTHDHRNNPWSEAFCD